MEALSDRNSNLLKDKELKLLQNQRILSGLNSFCENHKREFFLSDRQVKNKSRNERINARTPKASTSNFVIGEHVSCINENITVVEKNKDNESITAEKESDDNKNFTEFGGSKDNVEEGSNNENITQLGENNEKQCSGALQRS